MRSYSSAGAEEIATLAPKSPPLPAKAKHVVHIFAQGAPSHVDTWDPKPALAQYDGKSIPGMDGVAMASPFKFERKGQVGHRSQRGLSEARRTGRRHDGHPLDVHGYPGARGGDGIHEHRFDALFRARAWGRGCFTVWERKTRTCPGLFPCAPAARRRAAVPTGRRPFCRACTRA